MTDPLFWLVLSFLFVTISLTIVLAVAVPALKELARAARSAEKLFDTLSREFPPTLEAIRLTGMEISDLTDDVSEGVQSAGQVVKQVDESLSGVRKQAKKVQSGTRSLLVGIKAAWRTFNRPSKPTSQRRSLDRLPPGRPEVNLADRSSSHRNSPEELLISQPPVSQAQVHPAKPFENPSKMSQPFPEEASDSEHDAWQSSSLEDE